MENKIHEFEFVFTRKNDGKQLKLSSIKYSLQDAIDDVCTYRDYPVCGDFYWSGVRVLRSS